MTSSALLADAAAADPSEPAKPVMLTAVLPCTPPSAGRARRVTRAFLDECPRVDDIELIVSELVTNSVLHSASSGAGTVALTLALAETTARVTVIDDGTPSGGASSDRNDHGRGLDIVRFLAAAYDLVSSSDRTETWAEVAW